jgi:hypothetical protein
LEFQVKCTAQAVPDGSDLGFELSKKNYDDLRVGTVIPRLLFVLTIPEQPEDWLHQSERRMVLRRSGYWASLRGLPDLPNTTTITVRIPRSHLLTPEALRSLMSGEIPQ